MYVKVKTTPGTKKESFVKESETVFKISVKEPAKRNLANKRIIELVAKHFKVLEGKVRIISGHHHPSKLLYVEIG